MRIFDFDASTGYGVDRFDSRGAMYARIARLAGDAQVGSMTLEPGGVIGWHPATVPQLFLVVQGEGEVCGDDRAYRRISAGQAAFWQAGEMHETRSASGLVAILVEGEGVDSARFKMRAA